MMPVSCRRLGWLMVTLGAIAVQAQDACAAKSKMEGNTYVAPHGGFQCEVRDYDLGETKIKDGYETFNGMRDKYRGTAAFNGFFDITRVDFEDFAEPIKLSTLTAEKLEHAYTVYFDERIVPLVKSGVKDATVILRKFVTGDPATYASVMRLPARDGEQVRGAIEYTDGHAMYVVSVARPTRPELGIPIDKEVDDVLTAANAAFKRCRFPSTSRDADK